MNIYLQYGKKLQQIAGGLEMQFFLLRFFLVKQFTRNASVRMYSGCNLASTCHLGHSATLSNRQPSLGHLGKSDSAFYVSICLLSVCINRMSQSFWEQPGSSMFTALFSVLPHSTCHREAYCMCLINFIPSSPKLIWEK